MRYVTALLTAIIMLWPSSASASMELDDYYAAWVVASRTDADFPDLIEEWEKVPAPAREAIVRAVKQLGSDWVYATSDPDVGFDCSGLVRYAWDSVEMPKTSRYQIRYAYEVEEPRPGDILYYPGHVMIYLGDGVIIHSANRRTGVVLSDFPDRAVKVGRILPPVGTTRAF